MCRKTVYIPTAAACREYSEISGCTDGFPSLFHIDKLAKDDNTGLETKERRQVVIPAINFGCDGSITRWIFGARWQGDDDAYTELQIWRKISDNQYMKVNGTSLIVGARNGSEVYEYELETPIAFQEGDILGYFQPKRGGKSQLDLYLEKSGRITTYHTMLGDDELDSPSIGDIFTIIDGDTKMDTRYPLIAVRTGATQTWFVIIMILFFNLRSSRLWVWFHVRGESVCTARYTITQHRVERGL